MGVRPVTCSVGLLLLLVATTASLAASDAVLYAIDIDQDQLVTVNATTGEVTPIGDLGVHMPRADLAVLDGRLYAVTTSNSLPATVPPVLYELDIATGAATRLGDLTLPGRVVYVAEGLTARAGNLCVSFATIYNSSSSRCIGTLSLAGVISTSFVDEGSSHDKDGLATDASGRIFAIDCVPPSNLTWLKVSLPAGVVGSHAYDSIATDDLEFAGADLYAIGALVGPSPRQTYIERLDPATGSLLGRVPFDRTGFFDGLALAWFVSPNQDPTAVADGGGTLECTSPAGASVTLDGTGSSDPDGDVLTYEWSAAGIAFDDATSPTPTATFPIGTTLVTLTVMDGRGGVDATDVEVSVVDTRAPVVACTTDLIGLWPPNHEMVAVTVLLEASDLATDPEDFLVECTAASSEPDDATGDGSFTGDVDGEDGYTSPVPVALAWSSEEQAWIGVVYLRAERDGGSCGRTYSITCYVEDGAGNSTTASCVVVVPLDKRGK